MALPPSAGGARASRATLRQARAAALPPGPPELRARRRALYASCDTPKESEESHESGPSRRDSWSDESNFVGATGGDPRVDESNTQPPRRSLVSGPVGATRRTTAERVESTVELCVGATSRLVATTLKLESVRVASRLDAPGPGSCLGQPCVPTCSFLSILQKGERKNYSVLQSTHFPALLCYIHVSKTQNVPTHFLSRTTTRRRDPGRPA